MRQDMAKVIVERPRRYESYPRSYPFYLKNVDLFDEDGTIKNEGMRKPHVYRHGGKELNENLAPLKRFLRSRVGRPWDEVFSEICKNINVNSAVQNHIREHIFQYVEINIEMRNGIPYWINYGKERPLASESAYRAHEHLYVDPDTGILSVIKDKKKEKEKDILPIKIDDSEFYDIINGHWFWVKTEWMYGNDDRYGFKYEKRLIIKNETNLLTKLEKRLLNIRQYDYVAYSRQIIDKRQLSKKEIKKIKKKYGLV